MKSNAPWSVKGIERDARETAKEAARRQGMTVGEWLNQMIYTAGDPEASDGNIEGLKVTDLVTAIEHLNKRLAEMESSSSMAFSELSRNVGGIVERTQRLERSSPTDAGGGELASRVEQLERGGKDRQRVEALKALEKAVAQVAVQFNNAQKTSLERIDATEQQIQQLAERMDEGGAVSGDEATSGVAYLKDAFDGLSARVARAEKIAGEATRLKSEAASSPNPEFVEQTGARLRILGDEIKRGGDQIRSLEGIVTKLSEQIDAAELRSAEGIQKVSESIADLATRVIQDGDRNQERAEINAAIETARKDADERIAELQHSLTEAIAKADSPRPVIAAVNEPDAQEPEDEEETKPLAFDISNDIEEMVSENEDPIAAIKEESDETDPDADLGPDLGADPFSLEDDAEVQTSTTNSDSDDFSFDFDDEDDAPTAVAEDDPSASEARALLTEVRQAFGSADEQTDDEKQAEDTTSQTEAAGDDELGMAENDSGNDDSDDLDSIFAELDALKEGAAQESGETDDDASEDGAVRSVKARAKALLAGNESGENDIEPSDNDDASNTDAEEGEDFLKAARRRAQEAALDAAEAKKRTRRNLTPKQKAILAARARQKRRAEREDSIMSTPAPAPAFDADENEEAEEEKTGLISKLSGLFGSKSDRDTDKDDFDNKDGYAPPVAADSDESEGDNKAAFATLKSAITARPMTLVLGVAIILTAVALFFLVKDLVSQPNLDGTRQTEGSSATSANSGNDTEAVAELPAAPTINPRTLYSDSMTALNTASDDAQIAAAIVKLQDAAALGFPPAQLQLGELYKTGQGLEQDLGQARIWFRRAANGGNVLAMHRIGVMTARGDGGTADTREAIGWFERAASFGLVDSQYNLGAIFHPSANGDPTPVQDAGQAYFWYSLAARSGDTQAGPLAAGVAGSLNAEERQEIDSMIESWVSETPDPAANEIAVTN